MYGITFDTWENICKMYFDIKRGRKKSYLQWFPFSKLTTEEESKIASKDFFYKYISTGAFCMFPDAMLSTDNFIQKSDGSFRDATLLSPILYLVLQSVGSEISKKYIPSRSGNIDVFYAGNYKNALPLYKQEYDNFYKSINSSVDKYQYFIKTDISNFFPSINIDKLINRIDEMCNSENAQISQNQLTLYKELISYCGRGRFPLVENSMASSYLATVVYLDEIDCRIYNYILNKISIFDDFRMIRYVDDMYILISSDKQLTDLHEAYNEIINEYSSVLKEWGLSLNSKKCCLKQTFEICNELKKSLYDEIVNDKKCEISRCFSGKLIDFVNKLSVELIFDFLNVEQYNQIVEDVFSREDIEFTASEVLNYLVYEENDEIDNPETQKAISRLVEHDVSFITLDPKRLTVMIMRTKDSKAIKGLLNHLFDRNREGKWNSYDTTIAISYLIQSKFQHIDLLRILSKNCPDLYRYYYCACKRSFIDIFANEKIDTTIQAIENDKKSYYLYFMYLMEQRKHNILSMYAFYKNYFDRITAHLAYIVEPEQNSKGPNYKKYYSKGSIIKLYEQLPNAEIIIEKAHNLRNANPLSHASAELIDSDSTTSDIVEIIKKLDRLVRRYIKENRI